MKISFFTPIILVSFVFGLNPKKLPNGKNYKYIANKLSPSNDLKVIEPSQAAIISRNWLQNIIADMFSSTNQKRLKDDFNDNNLVNYDDLHIVTNINKLESYIPKKVDISLTILNCQTVSGSVITDKNGNTEANEKSSANPLISINKTRRNNCLFLCFESFIQIP